MLEFAKRLKSIQSALLNLVELGPGTRQIGPISGYISTLQLHISDFQLMVLKIFRRKWQSDTQEHRIMRAIFQPYELQTPIFHQ